MSLSLEFSTFRLTFLLDISLTLVQGRNQVYFFIADPNF